MSRPRNTCGCADQQARRRAGGNVAGFRAGDLGEIVTRRLLEFFDAHAPLRGLAHGVKHVVIHRRAAKPRQGTRGVDNALHAKFLIEVTHWLRILSRS